MAQKKNPIRTAVLSCGEVRERLYPLLLRTLPERDRAEAIDHTRGCEGCAGALAAVRVRLERVGGLPPGEPEERRKDSAATPRRIGLVLIPAALLAAVYTLLVGHVVEVARYREEQAFVNRVEKALHLYQQDFGDFPPGNGMPLAFFLSGRERGGPYLAVSRERLDAQGAFVDRWGNRYLYRHPGVHNPRLFDLQSYGANGRDDGGAGDDLSNW